MLQAKTAPSPLSPLMSSLAGALDPAQDTPDTSMSSPKAEDDEDTLPAPDNHAVDSADEDSKEELNDLFGEDEDVNMVEHECVPHASPH